MRDEKQLVRSVSSAGQRAALLAGKMRAVTGRTSIVAEDFRAELECGSGYLSARFVAFARPVTRADAKFAGGFGCGY